MAKEANGKAGAAVSISENVNHGLDNTGGVTFATVAGQFQGVRETIQKVNTYELPEILAYRVDDASDGFGDWIVRMTERPKKRISAARSKARRPAAVSTIAS
jgi:hypothetical protein